MLLFISLHFVNISVSLYGFIRKKAIVIPPEQRIGTVYIKEAR